MAAICEASVAKSLPLTWTLCHLVATTFVDQSPPLERVGTMQPEQIAVELGIPFPELQKGYLNLVCRTGNLLFISGHVSTLKGKVGAGVSTEQGYEAAKECATKILQSIKHFHGTLNGLRVIKLLGCVNTTPEYTDQHLVINGASDLFHKVYGKDGAGYHARSALGFAQLPTGAAVEVEAIFEVV
jgi:enamine deaminase RidA (YjgF/YER057c/UK114 family)